jgi:hypothetical protein
MAARRKVVVMGGPDYTHGRFPGNANGAGALEGCPLCPGFGTTTGVDMTTDVD